MSHTSAAGKIVEKTIEDKVINQFNVYNLKGQKSSAYKGKLCLSKLLELIHS